MKMKMILTQIKKDNPIIIQFLNQHCTAKIAKKRTKNF